MPEDLRFGDPCSRDGCSAPVVKLVADTVRVPYESGESKEVVGLCRDHKRDPKVRYKTSGDYVPDPDEEMPF